MNAADKYAASVVPKQHPGNTKVLRFNAGNGQAINVEKKEVEEVDRFCYLANKISVEESTEKEVNIWIGKAASGFDELGNIWKSTAISTKAKATIYKACVRPVLLYFAEALKKSCKRESLLRGFEGRWLRRNYGLM